ncbi:MAG TPA: DUF1854 domain-containing protein [Nitrosospira sp.]|jgi:hypothetical protein|nr:DUF1854 domain-containing protein [Nitrosospira sp.]
MTDKPLYRLSRDPFGRLVFTGPNGEVQEGIVPVRAFPITAPEHAIALVDQHGHELAWIEQLSGLPDELRIIIEAELASREFVPEILRIRSASSFITPSIWQVETDRGETSFILKGEEDIRRLTPAELLITDSHGVYYLLRDRFALDHQSRKILDRFL